MKKHQWLIDETKKELEQVEKGNQDHEMAKIGVMNAYARGVKAIVNKYGERPPSELLHDLHYLNNTLDECNQLFFNHLTKPISR